MFSSILAIVGLLVAIMSLVWHIHNGLQTGKILYLRSFKNKPDGISRNNSPKSYWFVATAYFVLAVLCVIVLFIIIADAN